jgi:hypothetical protein
MKVTIAMFGEPEILLTDNGTEFENVTLNEWCEQKKIKHLTTSTHHPQANGVVERFNGTLINMLRKATNGGGTWMDHLDDVVAEYNSSVVKDDKLSPYELVFGQLRATTLRRSLESPLTDTLQSHESQFTRSETVKRREDRSAKEQVKENGKRKPARVYKPGEMVWKRDFLIRIVRISVIAKRLKINH